MRVAMAVLGCLMAGSVLFAVSAASGAGMPAGGPVSIFVTPSPDGIHGPIVITGAIGDHGQTTSIDKNGKPDANGNFVRITLKKGTFEVNSTALNAKTDHGATDGEQDDLHVRLHGDGAGNAVQRHGSLQRDQRNVEDHDHVRGGRLCRTARAHKGQCNFSNNAPLVAQYGSIMGKGAVQVLPSRGLTSRGA